MRALANTARFFASHPLTRDAQLRAWGRFIEWQIKSRVKSEVIVPWISGQRLVVRRGMTGATGNIYAGLHEFADMMLPLHFLRPGDLFLDIGANVGSYTVLASGVRGARTWAFEPAPETLPRLRQNISINALDGLVTVFELALGARDGDVRFTVGQDTVNHIADDDDAQTQSVQQRRLDGIIGDQHPIMIKMDVEGHEEGALRGATGVLDDPTLRIIELETVTPVIAQLMADHDFGRAYYDPFSRALSREPAGNASNAVFVRDWPFVTHRLATAEPVTVLGRAI